MNGTSQSVFTQLGPLMPAWIQQLSGTQQILLGLAAFPFVAIALNVFWQLVSTLLLWLTFGRAGPVTSWTAERSWWREISKAALSRSQRVVS
jgi:hypothetical protein